MVGTNKLRGRGRFGGRIVPHAFELRVPEQLDDTESARFSGAKADDLIELPRTPEEFRVLRRGFRRDGNCREEASVGENDKTIGEFEFFVEVGLEPGNCHFARSELRLRLRPPKWRYDSGIGNSVFAGHFCIDFYRPTAAECLNLGRRLKIEISALTIIISAG